MRDVAVLSYAASAVAKETKHNEVEIITPVIREAVEKSGIPSKEIGFTCSGSLDYLFGGPFAFVQGMATWISGQETPPVRTIENEMTRLLPDHAPAGTIKIVFEREIFRKVQMAGCLKRRNDWIRGHRTATRGPDRSLTR